MAYTPQFGKSDTLSAGITDSDTTATLSSGNFTNFTSDYLVIDYDVPAKVEVVKCTVTGTAISSMTRAQEGTAAVAHDAGAKVGYNLIPTHYNELKLQTLIDADQTGGLDQQQDNPVQNTEYVLTNISQAITTTGGDLKIDFNALFQASAACTLLYNIYRDTTKVAHGEWACSAANLSTTIALQWLNDSLAAGTYTYTVKFGISTTTISWIRLYKNYALILTEHNN